MSICRLCNNDRELRLSHIIPEFLWKELYDDNHSFYGITGRGLRGHKILQKGLRERLFCDACEQLFNESFEKPFKARWVDKFPLPTKWGVDDIFWINVDYPTFKLFHLSVLFRAHVSSLEDFGAVQLGSHAETIRKMLLDSDPGDSHKYPIFGYAILNPETKEPVQIVSSAQASRMNGAYFYGMMYGGVEWWVCVASHRVPDFEKLSLRADGAMPIGPMSMEKIGSIQRTSKAYHDVRKLQSR